MRLFYLFLFFLLFSLSISQSLNVTIDQEISQNDPTNSVPVVFTAVFTDTVDDFTDPVNDLDITCTGCSICTAAISPVSSTDYTISISGMTNELCDIVLSIPASVANHEGTFNSESTSTDNIVSYDKTALTVTSNQHISQNDPAISLPLEYTLAFNKPTFGLTTTDISLSGCSSCSVNSLTPDGYDYTVSVIDVLSTETVSLSLLADKTTDIAGNLNEASTSTDNSVKYVSLLTNSTQCVEFDGTCGLYDTSGKSPGCGCSDRLASDVWSRATECPSCLLTPSPANIIWEDGMEIDSNTAMGAKVCCSVYTTMGNVYIDSMNDNFDGTNTINWLSINDLSHLSPWNPSSSWLNFNGLSSVTSIGRLTLEGPDLTITSFSGLNNLATIDTLLIQNLNPDTRLTSINLPGLTTAGSIIINHCFDSATAFGISQLYSLQSITINSMTSVTQNIYLEDIPILSTLSFNLLNTIGGTFQFKGRNDIDALTLPALANIHTFRLVDLSRSGASCSGCNDGGVISLTLDNLLQASVFEITNTQYLSSISVASLATINTNLLIDQTDLNTYTHNSLTGLSSIDITFSDNSLLTTISFNSLPSLNNLIITNNPLFTTLNMPLLHTVSSSLSFISLTNFDTINLPSLTSVHTLNLQFIKTSDLDNFPFLTQLTDITISNNANLVSIKGFNKLIEINGLLSITNNPLLTTLTAFYNVTTFTSINLDSNTQLQDISGLCGLMGSPGFCSGCLSASNLPQVNCDGINNLFGFADSAWSTLTSPNCNDAPLIDFCVCKTCTLGQYCHIFNTGSCIDCTEGYYCPKDAEVPTPCSNGYYSEEGSAHCSGCVSGSYSVFPASTCSDCNIGDYQPDPLQDSCLPCPFGEFTNHTGSTSCEDCFLGHFCVAGIINECLMGTFAETTGLTLCTTCSSGEYTPEIASTTCKTCEAGYRCINGLKYNCNPGEYSLSGVSTCSLCDPGTYNNSNAATMCYSCDTALYCSHAYFTGYYANSTGSTGCDICPLGHQCSTHIAIKCDNGLYANDTGFDTCLECPRGYQCSDTSISQECQPGTYSADSGLTFCSLCISGTYTLNPISYYCTDCLPGQACPNSNQPPIICLNGTYTTNTRETECHPCTTGHYCDITTILPIECPVGTFSNSTNMTACTECFIGSYTDDIGHSSCHSCIPGYYCPNSTASVPCSMGFYAHQSYMTSCIECSIGYFCDIPNIFQRKCPAGSFNTVSGLSYCQNCTVGEYQNLDAQSFCSDCWIGHECSNPALLPQSCLSGTYANTTRLTHCYECWVGFQCSNPNTLPVECLSGTFSIGGIVPSCTTCNTEPLSAGYCNVTQCDHCEICPSAYYCPFPHYLPIPCPEGTASGGSGAVECIKCSAGWYCPDPSQAPYPCLAGTYQNLPYQSFCHNCTVGTFCDSAMCKTCQNCTLGHYCPTVTDDEIPCTLGTYANQTRQTTCQHCRPSYYCPSTITGEIPCDIGQYNSMFDQISCNDCPLGSYCPSTTEEYPCLPGQFSNVTLMTTCHHCLVGWYQPESSKTFCYKCPPGASCPDPTQPPSNCTLGYFSNVTSCKICYPGYYCPDPKYYPIPCLAGLYSGAGSTTCGSCIPGSYSPANASSTCNICNSGYFSAIPSATICNRCPDGQYQTFPNGTQCHNCEIGHYCLFNGTQIPCSRGYYSIGLQTTCILCNEGYYTLTNTSSICHPCPTAQYCPTPFIDPFQCEAGTYNDQVAQTVCQPCMAGTYNDDNLIGKTVCTACIYSGQYIGATSSSSCNFIPTGKTLTIGSQWFDYTNKDYHRFGYINYQPNTNISWIVTVPDSLLGRVTRVTVRLKYLEIEDSVSCTTTYLHVRSSQLYILCGGIEPSSPHFFGGSTLTTLNNQFLSPTTVIYIKFISGSTILSTGNGFWFNYNIELPYPVLNTQKYPSYDLITGIGIKQIGVGSEPFSVSFRFPSDSFINPNWALILVPELRLSYHIYDFNNDPIPFCSDLSHLCDSSELGGEISVTGIAYPSLLNHTGHYPLTIIAINTLGYNSSTVFNISITLIGAADNTTTFSCIPSEYIPLTNFSHSVMEPIVCEVQSRWKSQDVFTRIDDFSLTVFYQSISSSYSLSSTQEVSTNFIWNIDVFPQGGILNIYLYYKFALFSSKNVTVIIPPDETSSISCSPLVVEPFANSTCSIITRNQRLESITRYPFLIETFVPPRAGSYPSKSFLNFSNLDLDFGSRFSFMAFLGNYSGTYEIELTPSIYSTVIVVETPDITSYISCTILKVTSHDDLWCSIYPRQNNQILYSLKNHFSISGLFSYFITADSLGSSQFSVQLTHTGPEVLTPTSMDVTLYVDGQEANTQSIIVYPKPDEVYTTMDTDLVAFPQCPINANFTVFIRARNNVNQPLNCLAAAFELTVKGGKSYSEIYVQEFPPSSESWVIDPEKLSSDLKFTVTSGLRSEMITIDNGVSPVMLVYVVDTPDNSSFLICEKSIIRVNENMTCTLNSMSNGVDVYTLFIPFQIKIDDEVVIPFLTSGNDISNTPSTVFNFLFIAKSTSRVSTIIGTVNNIPLLSSLSIYVTEIPDDNSIIRCQQQIFKTIATAYTYIPCTIEPRNELHGSIFASFNDFNPQLHIDNNVCSSSVCSINLGGVIFASDILPFTIRIDQSYLEVVLSDGVSNSSIIITTVPPAVPVTWISGGIDQLDIDTRSLLSHEISGSSISTPSIIQDSSKEDIIYRFSSVSCTKDYCMAASHSGYLLTWGIAQSEILGREASSGMIGKITTSNNNENLLRYRFIQVCALKGCIGQENSEDVHNIALTSEGYILYWNNTHKPHFLHKSYDHLKDVRFTKISSDGYFFLAATETQVYSWASELSSTCIGRSAAQPPNIPYPLQFDKTTIIDGTDIIQIVTGPNFGMVVMTSRIIWSWGDGLTGTNFQRWNAPFATYMDSSYFGFWEKYDVISLSGNTYQLLVLLRDRDCETCPNEAWYLTLSDPDGQTIFGLTWKSVYLPTQRNIKHISIGRAIGMMSDSQGSVYIWPSKSSTVSITRTLSPYSGGNITYIYSDILQLAVCEAPTIQISSNHDPNSCSTSPSFGYYSSFDCDTLGNALQNFKMIGTIYELVNETYVESHTLPLNSKDLIIRAKDANSLKKPLLDCSFSQCFTLGSSASGIHILGIEIINGNSPYGGVLQLPVGLKMYIDSCHIWNCSSEQGGVFNIQGASILISNSILENNQANLGGAIFGLQNNKFSSELIITFSHFKNNLATDGGSIYISNSELNISQSHFLNNRVYRWGGAIFASRIQLHSNYLNFINNNADSGGAIFIRDSEMTLTYIIIDSNKAISLAGGMYVEFSDLLFNNSEIFNNFVTDGNAGALYIQGNRTIKINDCIFEGNFALSSGGACLFLYCEPYIYNTLFISNLASIAGALAVRDQSGITLKNSRFFNNTAIYSAGAISLRNTGKQVKIILDSIIFKKNKAKSSDHITQGGAMEVYGLLDISYTNITSVENYADSGGFIFWTAEAKHGDILTWNSAAPPIIEDNGTIICTNNSAIHGDDYATPPLFLVWTNVISNIQKSNEFFNQPISVELLDYYNQVVKVDSSTAVSISTNITDANPIGTGLVQEMSQGSVTFPNNTIGIIYRPDSLAFISGNCFIALTGDNLETIPMNIHLDGCDYGQYISQGVCKDCLVGYYSDVPNVHSCSPCPPGTFIDIEGSTTCLDCYPGTFSAGGLAKCRKCTCCSTYSDIPAATICKSCIYHAHSSDTNLTHCTCDELYYQVENSCLICPEGANCSLPGTTIENVKPLSGWYSSLDGSNSVFYRCPNPDACLQSHEVCDSSKGYTGNLCQQCIVGYARYHRRFCFLCPWNNGFRLLFVIFIYCLFLFLIVRLLIRSGATHHIYPVLFRIFISSIQFNALVLGLVVWPSFSDGFFSFIRGICDMLNSVYYLECTLGGLGVSAFLFQGVVFWIMFVVVTSGSYFLFWIWHKIRKWNMNPKKIEKFKKIGKMDLLLHEYWKPYYKYYIALLICVLYFVYPVVLQFVSQTVQCQKLSESNSYLSEDLDIPCWTGEHWDWFIGVTVPFFLLFIIGAPALVCRYFYLAKSKILHFQHHYVNLEQIPDPTERMHMKHIVYSFVFLYKGYQEQYFFWEGIVSIRKIIIVFIIVFISKELRILFSMLLIVVALILTAFYQPYTHPILDVFEMISLTNSFITFFFSQFLDPGLGQFVEWYSIVETLIMISNIGFICLIGCGNIFFFLFINIAILYYWQKPPFEPGFFHFSQTFLIFLGIKTRLCLKLDNLQNIKLQNQWFLSNLATALLVKPMDRLQIGKTQTIPPNSPNPISIIYEIIIKPCSTNVKRAENSDACFHLIFFFIILAKSSKEIYDKLCIMFKNADNPSSGLWNGWISNHLDRLFDPSDELTIIEVSSGSLFTEILDFIPSYLKKCCIKYEDQVELIDDPFIEMINIDKDKDAKTLSIDTITQHDDKSFLYQNLSPSEQFFSPTVFDEKEENQIDEKMEPKTDDKLSLLMQNDNSDLDLASKIGRLRKAQEIEESKVKNQQNDFRLQQIYKEEEKIMDDFWFDD